MGRRYQPLSERQVRVLQWVADGCPAEVGADSSFKLTVYALADRGLVRVDRHRHSWSAAVTEGGRHYLETGTYDSQTDEKGAATGSDKGRRVRAPSKRDQRSRPRFQVSAADLVTELQSNEGTLTVQDPNLEVRSAYRSAISLATTGGVVPEGYVLRYSGRDHGDLLIRLVPHDEAAPVRIPLPAIGIPTNLDGAHDVVRNLRDNHPDLLDVGDSARPKALLILQAIAEECERRGYRFESGVIGKSTFLITVGDDVFSFSMLEEYERRSIPNSEELAAVKYEWQRARSTVQKVRSGRLVIRLNGWYYSASWADRKRWRLEDRLPQLFAHIDQAAKKMAEDRIRAERQRQERRRAWEAALEQAKKDYIADFNHRRLDSQVSDLSRAKELRRYAALIDDRATIMSNEDARRVHEWAAWTREQADMIDPLQQPGELRFVIPEDIGASEVDSFMPRGMNAWRPPE